MTWPARRSRPSTYTDRLNIGGVFHSDLYTSRTVNFTGALGSGAFQFIADTDNASAAPGGITLGIPEPETYALMLAGLGMAATWHAAARAEVVSTRP